MNSESSIVYVVRCSSSVLRYLFIIKLHCARESMQVYYCIAASRDHEHVKQPISLEWLRKELNLLGNHDMKSLEQK